MGSDEYGEKIAEELDEIFQEHLDAMRRAGVAERKREGYRIESTEALRLFREATGYLLRLRELRHDIEQELQTEDYYHAARVTGHVEDYNRILEDIRNNPSFENSIQSFESLSYRYAERHSKDGFIIEIEGNSGFVPEVSDSDWSTGVETHVPMDGTTTVETFVYPRLSRLTKEVENSLIGRCTSGKRPD